MDVVDNNTVYFRNPDNVNLIYDALKRAVEESDRNAEEVVISTNAGDFYLDRDHAVERLDALDQLDQMEPDGWRGDGKISDDFVLKLNSVRSEKSKKITSSVKRGFHLAFRKFEPSQLYLANYEWVRGVYDEGKLYRKWTAKDKFTREDELWIVAVTATLSGFSPRLIDYAGSMCNRDFDCDLSYALEYGIKAGTQHDESGNLPAHVTLTLSHTYDSAMMRYIIVHESTHTLIKRFEVANAGDNSKPFIVQFMMWCRENPEYADIEKTLSRFLSGLNRTIKDPNATPDQKAEAKSLSTALSYGLEEAFDYALVGHINPEAAKMKRTMLIEDARNMTALSPEDFVDIYRDTYDVDVVSSFRLAMHYGRIMAEEMANDIDAELIAGMEERARLAIGDDPDAVDVFNAFLMLSRAAVAYFKENEKFRHFIDDNQPKSYKR